MQLNEAKEILTKAGYLIEDTEDDELDAAFYDWDAEIDHEHHRAYNPKKAEELGDRYFKLRNKRMTLQNKIAMAKLNHLKKLLIDAGFETATVGVEDDDYERPILSFYYSTPIENSTPFKVYINFDKETGNTLFYCFNKNYHNEFDSAEKLVKHFE